MRIESREVLAAAYLGPNKGPSARSLKGTPHRMLSHAVELDAGGVEVRVLCNRVALESLADGYAGDRTAPPSCAYCRRRWDAWQARASEP